MGRQRITFMPDSSTNPVSPWPHRFAVLLVATTFPLIWIGGMVTSYEAGMAVPDWPTTYGYNLFLYPWQTWLAGPWDLLIEHGHRLLGAAVGLITIALVAALWIAEPRRWVRALGWVALAAVIAQGVLGGMRVLLDQRLLAKIHGCFGPAFFALATALAVVTSRFWTAAHREPSSSGAKLGRLAAVTTGLAYLQIVLGAQLRHVSLALEPSGFRIAVVFHLLVALLIVVHAGLMLVRVLGSPRSETAVVRPVLALAALVGVQLVLGAGSWILNYGWPRTVVGEQAWGEAFIVNQESARQALVTTAHVATGSLILATSLLATLRALRIWAMPERSGKLNVSSLVAGRTRQGVLV